MSYFLARIISVAFNVYEFMIIIRVFMSWVNPNPYSPIVTFIIDLTDPFLGLIEKIMPRALLAPLNFTPIVALLLLGFLQRIIFMILF